MNGDFPTLQPVASFIQDKANERVGDPVTRRADVLILAATNLNLEHMVQRRPFSRRPAVPNVIGLLHLPPLRWNAARHSDPGRPLLARFRQEYARPA